MFSRFDKQYTNGRWLNVLSNLLQGIREVLSSSRRPLSAKAIVTQLNENDAARVSGLTPWKTVGARLAVDIRSNPDTPFMRVERGMYALKEWHDLIPITVPPRHVNPVDEDILVLDRDVIERMKVGRKVGLLFDIDYRNLLAAARSVNRREAEVDHGLVQLIPSFVISMGNKVLSFKRTKKTPEQRLHDSYSIVFGGHLQSEDRSTLFAQFDDQVQKFLFRELHEELAFKPYFRQSSYKGVLHLDGSDFERQHAGVVFSIELELGTKVESLEPGFHSTLQFISFDDIRTSNVMKDRWSFAYISHVMEG